MVGSPGIAAFLAHALFWILLIYGWTTGALSLARGTVMLVLWLLAPPMLAAVPYEPVHAMFSSAVAVLDIALVFMIFKGDVRIT